MVVMDTVYVTTITVICFDVFTILPFLYLTAEKRALFQYPIMESPYQEKWLTSNDYGLKHTPMLSGNGRSLILGRYFPEQTIDIVSSDISEGIGGDDDMEEFWITYLQIHIGMVKIYLITKS